jgi:hypothetical protein
VSEGYSRYRDRWGHGLHGQVHWSATDVVADESFHLLDGRRCRNIRGVGHRISPRLVSVRGCRIGVVAGHRGPGIGQNMWN